LPRPGFDSAYWKYYNGYKYIEEPL
jgi:hypothetical protein